MVKKRRFNLDSPNTIQTPCDLSDLTSWFATEAEAIPTEAVRKVVLHVADEVDAFVRWPKKALLLWPGCDRREKYHKYPEVVRKVAGLKEVRGLDGRVNGPAVAAFRIADGKRPKRFGSHNSWSIHHLYSGKFPYVGKESTLRAAMDGLHFTQSAGLVAIHPIADQMCDEFPLFAWLLRANAFKTFGYDPDAVFAQHPHDQYGFVSKTCIVIPQEAIDREKSEEER